ncbi:MAG: prepilin peptidase [Nitrospirota bacterium]|nr:prepilin peptidase [Nitrospirota bacterium]
MPVLSVTIFLFGLIIGSFVNVCIYRLPRDESLVFPASHCPHCKTDVRAWQNIPVLSFLALRGKCGTCKNPIPWRYPLVELLHGFGFLFIFYEFGPTPQTLIYLLFFASLIAVIFIDLSHQIIPDVITLPGIVIGVIAATTILPPGLRNSLIGLFLGGGLFYLVAILSLALLKKEGMGGGDIKLIAMIGAFLGWQAMLLTIFLAALSGSVIGILMIVTKGRSRADMIPFGPYLVFGALTSLFWGKNIFQWYFSLGRV